MREIVMPRRAARTTPLGHGIAPSESTEVFDLLQLGLDENLGTALVTLVEVEGGSSRSIGAQMAVVADGRYCGYLSGGCIEAAVAAEAVKCIDSGHDAQLRFGVGSPFFDIRLPCGGSIELHVHVNPDREIVAAVRKLLATRSGFGLDLVPSTGHSRLIWSTAPSRRTGWHGDSFVRCYAPVTRLLLMGRGIELAQAAALGAGAGLDLVAFCADDLSAAAAEATGAATLRLQTPADVPALPVDPWTAAIFLFHDHDWENGLLCAALDTEAFFIGAMGSRRTHALRRERLLAAGAPKAAVDRIKGPVGLFGPTRDATSLAVSILADVTERRLQFDQS